MIRDPRTIEFEDTLDIIDYVSRGLIPKRKHVQDIVDAINDSPEERAKKRKGSDVIIDNDIVTYYGVSLEDVVTRIYDNRRKNRNAMLGIGGGALLLGFAIGSKRKSKKDSKEKEPLTIGGVIDDKLDKIDSRIKSLECSNMTHSIMV